MGQQMQMISYNTHLFGNTVAGIAADYKDYERATVIATLIKPLKPDLVCLCEVWDDDLKESFINACKQQLPYSYYTSTSAIEMGNGLLILSRMPMSKQQTTAFNNLGGSDQFAQKGVISTLLTLDDNSTVRLFLTHTQSATEYSADREKNLQQVAEQLQAYEPQSPAIICGDLNVIGASAEYDVMMKILSGCDDAYALVHPGDNGFSLDPNTNVLAQKFDEGEPPQRIDYVLPSTAQWTVDAIEVITDWKLGNGDDCSDHYPIRSHLNVK